MAGGKVAQREKFEKNDDEFLIKYIAKYNPCLSGRQGARLYKHLCDPENSSKWPWASRHPWSSWQNRYKTHKEWFDTRIAERQQEHNIDPNGEPLYMRQNEGAGSKRPREDGNDVRNEPSQAVPRTNPSRGKGTVVETTPGPSQSYEPRLKRVKVEHVKKQANRNEIVISSEVPNHLAARTKPPPASDYRGDVFDQGISASDEDEEAEAGVVSSQVPTSRLSQKTDGDDVIQQEPTPPTSNTTTEDEDETDTDLAPFKSFSPQSPQPEPRHPCTTHNLRPPRLRDGPFNSTFDDRRGHPRIDRSGRRSGMVEPEEPHSRDDLALPTMASQSDYTDKPDQTSVALNAPTRLETQQSTQLQPCGLPQLPAPSSIFSQAPVEDDIFLSQPADQVTNFDPLRKHLLDAEHDIDVLTTSVSSAMAAVDGQPETDVFQDAVDTSYYQDSGQTQPKDDNSWLFGSEELRKSLLENLRNPVRKPFLGSDHSVVATEELRTTTLPPRSPSPQAAAKLISELEQSRPPGLSPIKADSPAHNQRRRLSEFAPEDIAAESSHAGRTPGASRRRSVVSFADDSPTSRSKRFSLPNAEYTMLHRQSSQLSIFESISTNSTAPSGVLSHDYVPDNTLSLRVDEDALRLAMSVGMDVLIGNLASAHGFNKDVVKRILEQQGSWTATDSTLRKMRKAAELAATETPIDDDDSSEEEQDDSVDESHDELAATSQISSHSPRPQFRSTPVHLQHSGASRRRAIDFDQNEEEDPSLSVNTPPPSGISRPRKSIDPLHGLVYTPASIEPTDIPTYSPPSGLRAARALYLKAHHSVEKASRPSGRRTSRGSTASPSKHSGSRSDLFNGSTIESSAKRDSAYLFQDHDALEDDELISMFLVPDEDLYSSSGTPQPSLAPATRSHSDDGASSELVTYTSTLEPNITASLQEDGQSQLENGLESTRRQSRGWFSSLFG